MAETSHAQHGIWVTEQAGVAGSAYHLAMTIRFDGPLNRSALAAACTAVVRRHEPLRSAVQPDGTGLHLVPAAVRPHLRTVAYTDTLVRTEVARPFDLAHGPLARFVLADQGPDRCLLVVVAHHLVFDGMSKDVLATELADAYGAEVAGRRWTPDPLPTTFTRYAAGERALVADLLPQARDHWLPRRREPADPLLPGAGPLPGVSTAAFALPVGPLAKAAADLGATRFEVLLTVVHALLVRYGDPDPVVAVDVSTRTPEAAGLIGMFVNEIPVGGPLEPTLRAAVAGTRRRLRAAYRFRAVPVAHAVGGLRPRVGLAPVGVSYRRRATAPRFSGVDGVVDWQVAGDDPRGVLHLRLVDDDTTVGVDLAYRCADPGAAARIGAHLRVLLDAAVAGPDRALADLPVLPPDELRLIGRLGAGPVRRYPKDSTVVDLIADRVRTDPDRVAVLADRAGLTYRDLDTAADRLADRLRAEGIGPGSLVGIRLDRGPDLVVALLAVLRTGAAYLPLDPDDPPQRQAAVLSDSGAATLLTGSPTMVVPQVRGNPIHAAYVCYTSGSTGAPKGVVVSHRALANLLLAMAEQLASGPADRWLAATALTFDIAALELLLPLVTGGCVVLAPDVRDAAGVAALVRTHGVTHIQATPTGWRLLLDGGLPAGPRVAVSGGEALPAALAADLRGRFARLVNVYGPTETTIWSTIADLTGPDLEVTIGTPLANTRVAVLDGELRPVPLGVPGELWLAGTGLADGYLGRAASTAAAFRPEPDGPPGSRMYRTGDHAVLGADGRLRFRGRRDDQVKIRGHRIELGEVEAVLSAHPGVAAAAAVPDATGETLIGYVVPRPDRVAPDPPELRRHAAAALTAAAVPAAWVFLDELPTTRNGKLDRAALPPPATDRAAGTDAGRAVGVHAELVDQVTLIWQDILQLDGIAPDEDLFDLGGHSLTITRIMNRIQRQFGVAVPLAVFYDTPTVGGVCAALGRTLTATAG